MKKTAGFSLLMSIRTTRRCTFGTFHVSHRITTLPKPVQFLREIHIMYKSLITHSLCSYGLCPSNVQDVLQTKITIIIILVVVVILAVVVVVVVDRLTHEKLACKYYWYKMPVHTTTSGVHRGGFDPSTFQYIDICDREQPLRVHVSHVLVVPVMSALIISTLGCLKGNLTEVRLVRMAVSLIRMQHDRQLARCIISPLVVKSA